MSLCAISTHHTSCGPLSVSCGPLSAVSRHWFCCSCQVKVLLKMNRIHTIMSSDRMSPTLPQIKPQPAASTLAPTCTHPAEAACSCDVTCKTPLISAEPISRLFLRQQHTLSAPRNLVKSDRAVLFLPKFDHLLFLTCQVHPSIRSSR